MAIEDSNLTVQISAVRRALDEGRADGSCIRTVIGRGYRFLPEVMTELKVGVAPDMVSVSAAPTLSMGPPTVAVLPFENFSQDSRWELFCDGLVEDIITDLARHPDLLVIARQSSFAYKGRPTDMREIGRALGARYILEGSVQAAVGRLKVTTQLIDAASGVHIWADRYNSDEKDLFAVQEKIVDQVVAAVAGFGGSVLRAELTIARRKPPSSLQAYELYLLGYEQETRLDREGTLRSIELLKAAVDADPYLARAWIVLSWAYFNAANNSWTEDVAGAHGKIREAVSNAVALDPCDSLALAALTSLRSRDGDLEGARDAAERGVIAGARHADSLAFLAMFVSKLLDRPDEAVALVERSIALNPRTPTWYYLNHIWAVYFARRFDLVLEYFVRIQSDPTMSALQLRSQRLFRALSLAQLGQKTEAASAVSELCSIDPGLRVIQYVSRGLCPAARDLFTDGLRKARLNGLATSPSSGERRVT
jgi:TolB-like protein